MNTARPHLEVKILPRRCLAGALLLLVVFILSCNLPAHLVTRTEAPPAEETGLSPPLVNWNAAELTKTPFQPVPPTASFIPMAPQPPILGESTEPPIQEEEPQIPSETPAPQLPTATPYDKVWPAPNSLAPGTPPVTAVPPPFPLLSGAETVNFLLVGSDRRSISFRTDTIVIASVRPRDQLVTLISVPRDLFVYIPGWTMQRVNTAYQQGELAKVPGGGAALLKDTILYNLGIHIDHLAMVEFAGFRGIIDTLGGIDVPLACAFTDWRMIDPLGPEQDEDNWELYTLEPGLVHMDGDLALWYARSRLRSNDFDRGRRQQEVLRAIYARGRQLQVVPRLPDLYAEMNQMVKTDLSLSDLLRLAPMASDLSGPQIRSFYISRDHISSWRTPQGAAVLLPRREAMLELVQKAMEQQEEAAVNQSRAVVEIWNGTGQRDWETLAAERLHYAGFETRLGAADKSDYTRSQLYIFTMKQDGGQIEALLQALGLSGASLVAHPLPKRSQDYRLVLGADYNPCFDPARIMR